MKGRTGRRSATLALVTGLVVAGGAGVVLRDTSPRLAGADQVADEDGDVAGLSGFDLDGSEANDVQFGAASDVIGADDSLYVLFDGFPHPDGSTLLEDGMLQLAPGGGIERAGVARVVLGAVGPGGRPITAVGLGADGELALAHGTDVEVFGFDMLDNAELGRLHEVEAPFEVRAVGVVGRDEVVLGSAEGGELVVATPEGVAPLVEGEFGAVTSIAPLDDGTIAFVADGRLHVVDRGEVRVVATGVVNPVAAPDVDMGESVRGDRWPMAPISAGPDGRIVAVGEHEGHPRITLVDPDGGEVEVLADLEGVEPTVEERVAAAVVGEDLFFLAEGSLWRKQGVVG